ncbi:MAG: hypothetical protein SCJ94_02700 [Bacillota bacterium]|nr:hypothetical protein [Bacillota bacterium]
MTRDALPVPKTEQIQPCSDQCCRVAFASPHLYSSWGGLSAMCLL